MKQHYIYIISKMNLKIIDIYIECSGIFALLKIYVDNLT